MNKETLTYLDMSIYGLYPVTMANIKISSKVDKAVWTSLKAMADERHQNISGVLTEAIHDYVRRHRVRPEVEQYIRDSIRDHEALGHLLAK